MKNDWEIIVSFYLKINLADYAMRNTCMYKDMHSEALSSVGTVIYSLYDAHLLFSKLSQATASRVKKKNKTVQQWENEELISFKKNNLGLEWKPVCIWFSVAPLSSDSRTKNVQVKCAPPPSVSIFYSRILIDPFNVSVYPHTQSNRRHSPLFKAHVLALQDQIGLIPWKLVQFKQSHMTTVKDLHWQIPLF